MELFDVEWKKVHFLNLHPGDDTNVMCPGRESNPGLQIQSVCQCVISVPQCILPVYIQYTLTTLDLDVTDVTLIPLHTIVVK